MQWREFRSHIRHLPAKEMSRVERAFLLGNSIHKGQTRRSGEPFFSHPIAVAHILSDLGADADTIIAALLHDTIEDTPTTLEQVVHEFGPAVGNLIDGVTKLDVRTFEGSPNLSEQVESLRKMFTLMQQDIRIMLIKLIDRLHNMQTVEFLPPERQRLFAHETIDLYAKIADKLCMQDLRDELEALATMTLEPELFRRLTELREASEKRGNTVIEEMRKTMSDHSRLLTARTEILYEHKTWEQLRAQKTSGTNSAPYITVAFIAEDIDGCYKVLGALHQLWQRQMLSFQDFANSPQLNGYRGIHTTIIFRDGTRVRCKIRTPDMHDYARRGVASVCFGSKKNIGELLPWTKNIPSLSADTEGHSIDFWETLQSDILGMTMTVHGPGDKTVQLPQGSTVLDGAFHLFREQALSIASLTMNGLKVAFDTALSDAASIDVTLSDHETCDRIWLRSVQTGYAAAMIRIALMKHSEEQRIEAGKEMLQDIFTQRGRGFLTEFDEKSIEKKAAGLGFTSLNQMYISIADGKSEPQEMYRLLFERPRKKENNNTSTYVLRYTVSMDTIETMDRLNLVHRKYGAMLQHIRYKRTENGKAFVTLHVGMNNEEVYELEADLLKAGATQLTTNRKSNTALFLILGTILLWGLDPVFARLVLRETMFSPVDLTIVRFGTCFVAAAIAYLLHIRFSRYKSKPIQPLRFSLISSAFTLFCTAFFTYVSLLTISPTQYILFVILGVVAIEATERIWSMSVPLFLSFTVLLGTLIGVTWLQSYTTIGILSAGAASIGFGMYSELSKRFLYKEAHIHARYPAFVFWLFLFGMVAALAALPFATTLFHARGYELAIATSFSFIFTFLPYVLYFETMRTAHISLLNQLLPMVPVGTVLAELFLSPSLGVLIALPCVFVFLALLLWSRSNVQSKL